MASQIILWHHKLYYGITNYIMASQIILYKSLYPLVAPQGISNDGTYVWITVSNLIVKVNASTGDIITTFTANSAQYIVSDGTNVWVSLYNSNQIVRYNQLGVVQQTYTIPSQYGLAPTFIQLYLGNLWVVTNYGNNSPTGISDILCLESITPTKKKNETNFL
jgi:outer membrane lipoprotein-sorting protein